METDRPGDPVTAYLQGDPVPTPTVDDVTSWRIYLQSEQSRLMATDEAMTPPQAFTAIVPRIRGEYLAAFPAGEADEIFAPEVDAKEDASEPADA